MSSSDSRRREVTEQMWYAAVKLGADDPYVRAVRTGRTYGPYVRVQKYTHVRPART